ncbi:hypothetical protein SAMN05192558_113124 [Actinokineospora alba]|uniref:Secreted protein n=1 Tax=Actinokineospora alba TaxID=504798 RepID=A0A1H0V9E8_9PSEU|nr:hypothetical protein C8E96_1057 [Actinokineospora alba]SDH65732.1 hypothetical protein SAMN05421871_101878 [Actinokineospora alba]SDP75199.1 hypothetical protein SAMN05192558_113124 [Actinokineospora alba]
MVLSSKMKRLLLVGLSILSITVSAPSAVADDGGNRRDRPDAAKPVPGRPDPNAPWLEMVPDDGKDRPGATTQYTVAAYYLPFNFSYDFSTSLASRSFWPSYNGTACVNLRATGSTDPSYWSREIKVEMWNAYGVDTRIGLPVRYKLDGYYYGYCWYGLNPYNEHYFRLTKDWGPSRVWGDGWASPN